MKVVIHPDHSNSFSSCGDSCLLMDYYDLDVGEPFTHTLRVKYPDSLPTVQLSPCWTLVHEDDYHATICILVFLAVVEPGFFDGGDKADTHKCVFHTHLFCRKTFVALGRFAAECEATGVNIDPSRVEIMVPGSGGSSCHKGRGLSNSGSLEVDQRSSPRNAGDVLVCHGKEGFTGPPLTYSHELK